jgi:hypothetical protein
MTEFDPTDHARSLDARLFALSTVLCELVLVLEARGVLAPQDSTGAVARALDRHPDGSDAEAAVALFANTLAALRNTSKGRGHST